MSDTTETAFDPTESTRTLTSSPFKESNMTLREHQDTDKHYIGDSLPMPSLSQMKLSGGAASVGVLPFPARVDHVHDYGGTWGFFNSGYMTVAPGQVFINNLTWTGWGRNMLSSGQVLTFPSTGLYFVHWNIQCSRQAGGTFINEVNFIHYYNNGASSKTIQRQSDFDIPGYFALTVSDYCLVTTPTDNLQLAVQHNDGSNWDVAAQHLIVTRVASPSSS